ncbi:MAG: CAP domain-containing protein [Solirubrobacterales bacterium]|nr:CAP domain-containing protein [Solirubrobacterales bacterium]
MRRRTLVAAASLVVVPAATTAPADARPVHDRLERTIVRAINLERVRSGLQRLRGSGVLARAAHRHSGALLRQGHLSHGLPDGSSFSVRMSRVSRAARIGETLAWLPGAVTPRGPEVVRMWLRSPAHRAQLLEPSFRRVGVGGRRGWAAGDLATVVTAEFATAR